MRFQACGIFVHVWGHGCVPVRGPMSGRVRLCWDSQLPHGAIPGRAVYCSQFACLCIFASIGWVLIPFLFGHSSSPPQLPSLSSGLPLKIATKISQQHFAKTHTYETDKAVMWFYVMVGLKKMRIDNLWFASIIPRSKMTNLLPTLSKGHTDGCVCLLIVLVLCHILFGFLPHYCIRVGITSRQSWVWEGWMDG